MDYCHESSNKEVEEVIRCIAGNDAAEEIRERIYMAIDFEYSELAFAEDQRIKNAQTLRSQNASSSSSKDC